VIGSKSVTCGCEAVPLAQPPTCSYSRRAAGTLNHVPASGENSFTGQKCPNQLNFAHSHTYKRGGIKQQQFHPPVPTFCTLGVLLHNPISIQSRVARATCYVLMPRAQFERVLHSHASPHVALCSATVDKLKARTRTYFFNHTITLKAVVRVRCHH
jgi:hypothetical protein